MKNVFALILGAGLISGCATLTTDNATKVNVTTSNGKKIEVEVDGAKYEAPGVVSLVKDGQDKVIKTSDESCESATIAEKKMEPAFWVNVLLLSPASTVTDALGNKMWTYDDNIVVSCSE